MSRKEVADEMFDLSEKIREHRKKAGLTQNELAEKINVDPKTIQRLENAQCNTSIGTFFLIARGLGITPNELAPDEYGFQNMLLLQDDGRFKALNSTNHAVIMASINAMLDGLLLQQNSA